MHSDVRQGPPPASETLRLLRQLARKNVYAVVEVADEDSGVDVQDNGVGLLCLQGDGQDRIGSAKLATFHAAARSGWLVRETDSDLWRLSNAGRIFLRRALSRDDSATCSSSPPKVSEAGDKPQINENESPLGWLRRRKDKAGLPMISQVQFDAGEKLRADFWYAQMTPRMTTNWQAAGMGQSGRRATPDAELNMQEHIVSARDRVRGALSAVGPELSGILVDVCCYLKGLEQAESSAGWPKRSGKLVLQLALSSLARHYGSGETRSGGSRHLRENIRHWGTPDFRPSGQDRQAS